jgi:hypothetical protein
MNRKMRKMMREIERRGGTVGIGSGLPNHLAERFLRNVLDCPDCCEAATDLPGGMLSFDGVSIDKMLGGTRQREH